MRVRHRGCTHVPVCCKSRKKRFFRIFSPHAAASWIRRRLVALHGPKPWGPSTSGGDQAFSEVCAPTLQPKHERYHSRGGLAPDGRKEGAFRVINNSEEAGASKNEEGWANNNEYRCHCQRIEKYNAIEGKAVRSRNARESPSCVGEEEPRCQGITFSAVSTLRSLKGDSPARGGRRRAQTPADHLFSSFSPEKLEKEL